MTDAEPEERIRHAARAYLLYILGYTLFIDKTGTRVPVIYLRLLMNFDEARTYAWGAVTLAYLYRQLGFATQIGIRQIAGYLTLLEAWIYEHFPRCRPNPNRTYTKSTAGASLGATKSLGTKCPTCSHYERHLTILVPMR
ncbi:serine/threonine-protein phosphatase 7 long form isoform X1 [Cinnamomum micranthum f. kanehirae]|uniref:Serine/threonine-protein phosphatase 7 long form isoform X1 n=1 Tax=Cinnamomum micranthum f. kanehirae TaxID=337451 RepID=A0A3S3P7Y7_9MAGN|nr:serine/threonine-protein phosphatase 7 long form isoform X1 [Cinnamomum micranthum f. kanehirae]